VVLREPSNIEARGAMLLGAHEAGIAIEQSMLGATHACANPLTSRYGTDARRRNQRDVASGRSLERGSCRGTLCGVAARFRGEWHGKDAGNQLALRLEELALAGGLPTTLRSLNIPREDLPILAENATKEWTGTFNPRPLDAPSAGCSMNGHTKG
jgi:alcohol dehydrogenase